MSYHNVPTDFAALDALYPLPPEDLARQWVVTRRSELIPKGWNTRSLDGWNLGAHPDARLCDLRDRVGTCIGWVLEALVVLAEGGATLPTNDIALDIGPEATALEVEAALYGRDAKGRSSGRGLAGAWVAVLSGGSRDRRFRRVYAGPANSVMYSTAECTVAATHNLIPRVRRDDQLSRAYDPFATNGYYMLGQTAFAGIQRLMPNHYLDLDSFSASRHWPIAALPALHSGAAGAAAIADHSRRVLEPLAARYGSFRVHLSAGRDSRAVLALLRPFVERGVEVRLATSVGADFGSRTDLQAARRLARIARLPHEVTRKQRQAGSLHDAMRGFVRIGEARAGGPLHSRKIHERVEPGTVFQLGGMGGEAGRAYFWSGSGAERTLTAADLVRLIVKSPRKLRSLMVPAVLTAADAWLDGLPPWIRGDAHAVLDLAYIEQRLGCWQAPSDYLFLGSAGPRLSANPMTDAFSLETMLRLPEDYRAQGLLQHDMVQYGWPTLLEVPFNQPAGLLRVQRDFAQYAARARSGIGRLLPL